MDIDNLSDYKFQYSWNKGSKIVTVIGEYKDVINSSGKCLYLRDEIKDLEYTNSPESLYSNELMYNIVNGKKYLYKQGQTMKIINFYEEFLELDKKEQDNVWNEVFILSKLRNYDNILQYTEFSFVQGNSLMLSFGAPDFRILRDMILINIEDKNELPRKKYIYDIMDGLQFIHEKHIVHMDLNTRNIIVCRPQGPCKISGFEFASFENSEGTRRDERKIFSFMAPELLLDKSQICSQSMDIWSLGCIALELNKNEPLYHKKETGSDKDEDEGEVKKYYFNKRHNDESYKFKSQTMKSIYEKCTQDNPADRATILDLNRTRSISIQVGRCYIHANSVNPGKLTEFYRNVECFWCRKLAHECKHYYIMDDKLSYKIIDENCTQCRSIMCHTCCKRAFDCETFMRKQQNDRPCNCSTCNLMFHNISSS